MMVLSRDFPSSKPVFFSGSYIYIIIYIYYTCIGLHSLTINYSTKPTFSSSELNEWSAPQTAHLDLVARASVPAASGDTLLERKLG